jgi:hypothetical protein
MLIGRGVLFFARGARKTFVRVAGSFVRLLVYRRNFRNNEARQRRDSNVSTDRLPNRGWSDLEFSGTFEGLVVTRRVMRRKIEALKSLAGGAKLSH